MERDKEEEKKFNSFIKSLNTLTVLYNNLLDNSGNLEKDLGINSGDIPYLGAHQYQIFSEKLKLCFVYFIQVDKMEIGNKKKKDKNKMGKNPFLGTMIKIFKKKFPQNKFILELSNQTRNSVAHYSYYIEGSSICFCDSYFDNNPRCVEYNNFEKELKKLNIIVELFVATFIDDFRANWIYDF